MSWRNFKNLFKHEKFNESQFILGLDVGDATSAICYFDANKKTTEIIDISGGYGKVTVPTAIQYLDATKEWVFGEYAILNQGLDGETMLTNLVEKLGQTEYIEINEEQVSIVTILGLYIKELINSCKNINPNAEVVGIVVSTPDYFPEEKKQNLKKAFEEAGFEKELIGFYSQKESVLSYHFFNKKAVKETTLILDFGSRDIRGGIYNITTKGEEVKIKTLSYMFDENIGSKKIEETLKELFINYYTHNKKISKNEISKQDMNHISSFVYQNKDLIFQKNVLGKPIKLYFNFAFPPFQHSINNEEAKNIIRPFKKDLENFLERLIDGNMYKSEYPISFSDIDTVLCTGGGFEMFWPRNVVEDIFPDSDINFYKNSKVITAEGAAILAAQSLGVIEEKSFKIEDINQIPEDIGIFIFGGTNQKFVPIIKHNSFWWQEKSSCLVIVNQKTNKPFNIEIIKKDLNDKFDVIGSLKLEGLPSRPAGTTRLKLTLEYIPYKELRVNIIDRGFGELFKASDYNMEYVIPL